MCPIFHRGRQGSVIVTLESTLAAPAAKEATLTIPVIFMQGADPVRIGLVDSLSRPSGNLTGINLFLAEVAAKRLEFLLTLVPGVRSVAYLRNPTNPVFAESETREVEAAARSFGVNLVFFNASDASGIERLQGNEEAMHRCELVSTLAEPMNPFISLLAT
jgi:putative ABC transport system substrate-binding protein